MELFHINFTVVKIKLFSECKFPEEGIVSLWSILVSLEASRALGPKRALCLFLLNE